MEQEMAYQILYVVILIASLIVAYFLGRVGGFNAGWRKCKGYLDVLSERGEKK